MIQIINFLARVVCFKNLERLFLSFLRFNLGHSSPLILLRRFYPPITSLETIISEAKSPENLKSFQVNVQVLEVHYKLLLSILDHRITA